MVGCATRRNSAQARSDDFDRKFLVATVDHLNNDLRITRGCPRKNIRAELRQYCNEIAKDQKHEQQQMITWLQEWYQKTPSLDTYTLWLESQDGQTFERYFLKGMLEGHRETAEKAATCTQRAKHAELAELCKEITAHRTQEANRLERWNCEWYGVCD